MKNIKLLWTTDKVFKNLALSIISLVLFTSIHHVYGGSIYDTSWRIIMPLFFFLPMLGLTIFLQYFSTMTKRKSILFIFTVLTVLGWIIILGLGEGGYNHVLKNILYFGGATEELMFKMFPPELGDIKLYETPNSFFFELSGIGTTVFGVFVVIYLIPFFKIQWKRITSK